MRDWRIGSNIQSENIINHITYKTMFSNFFKKTNELFVAERAKSPAKSPATKTVNELVVNSRHN